MTEQLKPSFSSKVKALLNREPAELIERRKRHKPMEFTWLGKDESGNYVDYKNEKVAAVKAGDEQSVLYPTFHDMREHFVSWNATNLALKNKLDINAIYVDPQSFERPDGEKSVIGKINYQPLTILNADTIYTSQPQKKKH